MNSSIKDRVVLIVSVTIAVLIVGGSLYFLIYSIKKQKSDDQLMNSVKNSLQTKSSEEEIKTNLSKAEADLKVQASRLVALKTELSRQQAFLESMKSDFTIANSAVKETDILFEDPETSAPKIKVVTKTLNLQAEINQERLQIAKVLDSWKKEIDKIQTVGPNSNERAVIENNMMMVRSYLQNLQSIVEDLSVENSGLTQTVIDSYVSIVNEATESLNEIVVTLSSISDQGSEFNIYTGDSNSSNSNANTADSGSQQTNQTVVIPPVTVTPADVAAQQDAVDQAQKKVNDLQNVLNQNQNQSQTEIPVTNNTSPFVQGIIIDQPGQPQLIPGASRDEVR